MFKKSKNKKGFTLVELLVVIAIIGILVVVATPALFKNIQKAKVSEVEADYSAIRSAVLTRYAEYGELDRAIGDLGNIIEETEGLDEKTPLGGEYHIEVDMEYEDKDEHGNTVTNTYLNYKGYRLGSDGELKNDELESVKDEFKVALALSAIFSEDDKDDVLEPVKVTESQFKKLANDIGIDRVYYSTNSFGDSDRNFIYIGLIPQ